MAVAHAFLQDAQPRGCRHRRRQGAFERRAGQARTSRARGRPIESGSAGEFEVLGLPRRRGPAAEAHAQYMETPASAERRTKLREQQRLAEASRPRSDARPDKRERRRLMRLQRAQT